MYSVSLWLSFSAVMLLVIISIVLQQYKSKLAKTLFAQIYLAIFLVAISVYYFGGFSVVSILANIVAIPLVSFVIVPLLLVCLLLSYVGLSFWIVPSLVIKLLIAYLSFLTSYAGFIEYWSYFSFFGLII
ncbi:ComEC/Rec2 family competence protein, partial [Francisella orientalis]|nr:ComEC/Rec2 family competence protein [Francisella orientalis]